MAAAQPDVPALKVPRGRTADGRIDYLTLSFAELAAEAAAWRKLLARRGVRRGDRVLVMVRPGLPLIALVFALFQAEAVPVVIDPGMGRKSFLACVRRSQPRVLVGIPMARLFRQVFRGAFRSVEIVVPVSGSLTDRLVTAGGALPNDEARISNDEAGAARERSQLAAILFTSGSTGAPKGVCYEHAMFDAQVRLIREAYGIQPGEVDLPMLPIFALFNPALGMTTVVPEMDPRRPAEIDPARIVQAIQQEGVTNSFGSPTLWAKIGKYCEERNLTLATLRRVLCAGAPVPASLWRSAATWLPNGQLHSPYGATEALPVATISAAEVNAQTGGRGACVGHALPEMEVRIIAIQDGPIANLADTPALASGEIGEIIVRGPVVTREYDALPEATAAAKIPDGDTVWHRMGDCGYLDESGGLWFCGRKVERVVAEAGTLFTEPCEQVFRRHAAVNRCALVGIGEPGKQVPALVVESGATGLPAEQFARELRELAMADPATASIRKFYFHPRFPVDVRHNAKIHRLSLARWAARAHGYDAGRD